jgi:GT2 family glycosyltransferase/SAM-dependent methyltransferase
MSDTEARPPVTNDGERMVPEYDHDDAVYGAHIARYIIAQRFAAGARVLDVASGAGYGTAMLVSAGATSVVGVDRSEEAVRYSLEHYADPNVSFMVGDAQRLPFGAAVFDVVVSFETLEHLPDPGGFLDEVRRVLRPGGVFVVSTPNVEVYPEGNPFHVHEFQLDEFDAAVRARFPEVTLLGQDRWISDAVFPQDELEHGDPAVARPLPTTKITAKTLAQQQFLIAVCSDVPVPQQGAHVVIGTTSDAEYVRTELARRDVIIDKLAYRRAELQAQLKQLAADAWAEQVRLQEAVQARDRAIEARDVGLAALQAEAETLRSSTAWKLIERYRRGVEAMAPPASKRRDAYRTAIGGVRAIRARTRLTPAPVPLAAGPAVRGFAFPSHPEPRVSVVIPVHNGKEVTSRCLETLLAHTADVGYEVIVVDDASTDGTAGLLAATSNIQVIRNVASAGFLDACNLGAARAAGEHVVFLNNDTEVQPGWLAALLRVVDGDPTVGLVGSQLVYPDGTLQEAGSIIWSDGTGWNYGRGQDPDAPAYNYVRDVDYCSAACILVRRTVFEQIGGFDERYRPAYYEDTDLAFAVRAAGYRVVYQPAARVIHLEGASHGTDVTSGVKRYQEVNRSKFVEKWSAVLEAGHHPPGSDLNVARDRRKQKRALVLDEYVPAPDKDSGSCRMDHLLRMLGELGYLVTLVPNNQYADQPYTRNLQQRGIEVVVEEEHVMERVVELAPSMDVCILSRPQVAYRFLHTLMEHAPAAPLLYDTVDLHYVREGRRAEIEGLPSIARVAAAYKELELALVRSCDATITVTREEREIIERAVPGAHVVEIPNVHEVRAPRKPFSDRYDLVFVGNYNHTPNVDAMLYFVRDVLPAIRAEIPGTMLHVVGSHAPAEIHALAGPGVVVAGWIEDLDTYLEDRRVFVAPLRYGAGMKGKIGQAMAIGLPVVTTSVGSEGMDLTNGREVLVAEGAAAFAEAVMAAYRDESLWQRLSLNGRAHIERTLSPDVVRSTLQAVLSELPGTARAGRMPSLRLAADETASGVH